MLSASSPNSLRPTAASPAIAAGVDVLVVPRMQGHSDVKMVLTVHGHLFRTGWTKQPDPMDSARTRAPTESPTDFFLTAAAK
ncbi:integrase [Rathayibacter iranicus]|uniref:Integrase n=2 Tax=Rathayibacter iranicus TaxID=59737 RepID=A0AAD1AEC2_9MICO|nr:integrase [Rathayibacter iranicus]PPI51172.1 integrase [Rathayibacter iranicus]PPI63420.1 integrase [Rathayibacter iranicus]PPI74130.1 integrase [Rathayibacter iranicus]PWJ64337.1 hypothetical protein B0H03_105117 [Rathayibacter iranicus NCPPB 2253 = VKM Ac-1602]